MLARCAASLESCRFCRAMRVWLAAGTTDMRRGLLTVWRAKCSRRSGTDPFSGQLFVFRGRRGDLVKCLWWDTQGMVLYAKRLERGRFTWPQAKDGAVSLTPAQLSHAAGGHRLAHACPQLAA